jgi:hypothetical protein
MRCSYVGLSYLSPIFLRLKQVFVPLCSEITEIFIQCVLLSIFSTFLDLKISCHLSLLILIWGG